MYAKVYGTASSTKKFSSRHGRYNFNRTTVNSWKAKRKVANPTFKKAGRPNLLDETLLKKVKDIAIGTPLSYVSPRKNTFSFKGAKYVPIKGVDDKRQIRATLAVCLTGKSLPIQLIYKGKTNAPYQSLNFQACSHLVTQNIAGQTPKNHLSFSSKSSFHISRWLKDKMDTKKKSTFFYSWTFSKCRIKTG